MASLENRRALTTRVHPADATVPATQRARGLPSEFRMPRAGRPGSPDAQATGQRHGQSAWALRLVVKGHEGHDEHKNTKKTSTRTQHQPRTPRAQTTHTCRPASEACAGDARLAKPAAGRCALDIPTPKARSSLRLCANLVNDSPQPIFEQNRIEVDEKTNARACRLQVGNDLRHKERLDTSHSLDFNRQRAANDKVDALGHQLRVAIW
jgi:hypothetical protein